MFVTDSILWWCNRACALEPIVRCNFLGAHTWPFYSEEEDIDYFGIDFSDKYLNFSQKKWAKFKFKKLNLNNIDYLNEIKDFNPNFIFVNGALHHLDDTTVKNINKLSDIFTNSYFLSVDPVKSNNKILNKLMIKFDRGKFIRNKDDYSNLMTSSKNIILDDFYKMSFKQVLHYRNFELGDFYVRWKNSID